MDPEQTAEQTTPESSLPLSEADKVKMLLYIKNIF